MDKQIYVVGPRRFQNEILVHFLERETGAKCLSKEDIRHISVINDKNIDSQRLVLWDCLGKDLEVLMIKMKSNGQEVLAQHLVALFNVHPDVGIEEKTAALGVRGFFLRT